MIGKSLNVSILDFRRVYCQVHVHKTLNPFQTMGIDRKRYCLTHLGLSLNVVPFIMKAIVGLLGGEVSCVCLSINCQQILMDFSISRLANERQLKWKQWIIQSDTTKLHMNNRKLTEYQLNAALLLRSILYCSTRNKRATQIPTGYGPRAAKLF